MTDDLRQPLRQRRLADHLRFLRPTPLRLASLAAVCAALALAIWLGRQPAHMLGEPVVHVLIEAVDPLVTATLGERGDREPAEDEAEAAAMEPSLDDVEADRALAEAEERASMPRERPLTLPLKALGESGRFGTLPRVAANGRKPWEVYGRPFPRAALQSDAPKIAIVLGGMGLNEALTRKAIEALPGGVTFAFAPYGSNVQKLVNAARARGHEAMLHLPMEPFGYPAVDPGPRTLLVAAGPGDNIENLHWLMSRFSGYTGVLNYMGAKFTGDRAAFQPVASELGRRGLVYLDDGSSTRSLASELGGGAQLPVRRAERLIDPAGGFGTALNALRAAEADAQRTGLVVVVGSGLEETIEAVKSWAEGAVDRGVLLVPASAAFRAGRS